MKKYKFSWEHCYKDWRDYEFQASDDEHARRIAKRKEEELGDQITGGPELMLIGELIDY